MSPSGRVDVGTQILWSEELAAHPLRLIFHAAVSPEPSNPKLETVRRNP
jgi:hypothetical protein